MSPNNIVGWIIGIILIIGFFSYFYFTNPLRDAAMVGGGYLLRKYMKNKKKNNKNHK
jgi:hypothetical protein